MAKASEAAVRASAAKYWTGRDVDMAVEIARIESGFNLTAHNPIGRDDSYGAMQINMRGDLGPARRAQFGLSSNEQLYDLDTNMRVAHGIWLQNNQSFFGTQAWWTSAVTAAAKLRLTGLRGQSGSPADDEDDERLQAVYQALPQAVKDYLNNNVPIDQTPVRSQLPQAVTDEQWEAILWHRGQLQTGLGDMLESPVHVPNPLEWAEALKALLNILIDPQFWKRVGLGALGAAVIIIAVVFFTKSTVTSTVKDAVSE